MFFMRIPLFQIIQTESKIWIIVKIAEYLYIIKYCISCYIRTYLYFSSNRLSTIRYEILLSLFSCPL